MSGEAQRQRLEPPGPAARADAAVPPSAGDEPWPSFESLLVRVSADLAGATADSIDAGIGDAQRLVCEKLGLGLSALWQEAPDEPSVFVLTHAYRVASVPPLPRRMGATDHQPWALAEILAGRMVVLDSTGDAPAEAARDLEVWREFGVTSNLAIPLQVGDEPPFGALSFNDVNGPRHWSAPLIERLQLLTRLFAHAIQRMRSEQDLRRSEARLGLAAESAEAGLWSLDLATRRFWLTDRTRRIFGFGPDEVVTFGRFLEAVHPDHRGDLERALDSLLREGTDIAIEYAAIGPDGGERWLASRGRYHARAWGEPGPVIMGVTVDITARKGEEERLRRTLAELDDLRARLQQENVVLRQQAVLERGRSAIVGQGEPVRRMLAAAAGVAATDTTVLITGETGTGKELLARYIHDRSRRRGRPLVRVNCAALPAPLIECELFGRERGAYTGAMTRQAGRFEVAHGATILLDEIGDLPLELQAKLLRVLEDGTFERLGSTKPITVDARVIAATNRDLGDAVARGEFREDLFHRLNVFPIEVPPLRERAGDIPELVWTFVAEFNAKMGRSIDSIPKPVMDRMLTYAWPGNVRELRNAVERAMIISRGRSLDLELPGGRREAGTTAPRTLAELERKHILEVLEKVHWRISGRGGAAEILGLVPTTLHSRMKKLGIARPRLTD